jgi:ABC-type multidrug transport system fused ATPase/permease subunit
MIFEITGLGVFIPALILIVDEKFAMDRYLSFFADYGLVMTKSEFQILVISLLIGFQLVKFVYMTFITYRQQRYVADLSKNLGERLLAGYLNSSYRFHLDNNSSNLINNIQGELTHFIAVVQAFFMLLLEFLTIFGLLFLLFYVEFNGTLGVILILSISVLLFQQYARKRLLKFGTIRTENLHYAVKNLSNTLSSIKEVKIAGRESFFLNKYKHFNDQSIDALSKKETLQYIPKYYLEFISFCSLSALILVLLIQNQPIQSLLPTIGIFAGAAFRILPSVNRVLNSMQLVKFSEATIDKLYKQFSSFHKEESITENPSSIKPLTFRNTITLSHITYRYTSDGSKIFDDMSLTIRKNECIGIIGKSGSGKSTF